MRLFFFFFLTLSLHAAGQEFWVDTTGLTWTASDNGVATTHSQADLYCKNLPTDGNQKAWRLPTIDELQDLFGGAANAAGFHLRAPLKLSGWQWSSTPGREKGEAWGFDFGDGGRASLPMGDGGFNRALCVRP